MSSIVRRRAAASQSDSSATPPPPATANASSTDATDTPPVISINGNNPAIIHIGDAYADLGAIITGPQADLNLGISTFLNGQQQSQVTIDTSNAATDTIDYVVTDQFGTMATATRTVIIEPVVNPIVSNTIATSTATTSSN
jgi:hypothetical protein